MTLKVVSAVVKSVLLAAGPWSGRCLMGDIYAPHLPKRLGDS